MNTKRKKTGRKLLSFLLALAMILGLVPGMSLTAYAATAYTSGQIKIANLANGDIIRGTCTIYQNSNRALEIYDTDGTTLLQKYNFGKAQTLSALGYDTIVTKTGVGSGGYDNRLVKLQKLSPSPTVTSVTLDKNELSLDAGGATAELIATVEANYDAIKGVTWSSSDSTVATVNSNGVITPVGAGDPVTIKATSTWDNTKYAECVVTVNAAQTPTETLLTTITPTGKTTHSATVDGVVTVSHNNDSYYGTYGWLWMENADTLTVSACEGYTITKCIFKQNAKNPVTDSSAPFELHFDSVGQWGGVQCRENSEFDGVTSIEVYGYATPTATHSVTITPGDNMTKTDASGATSQSDLSGAMTDVVYTADDGYYFPTDYGVATVNGISVTWDSYTQITVSGTPTADATITLTAPTAKTTPAAPTTAGAVDCTTSDNNDGKLTGVTADMEYRKSDATEWTAGTGSDITGLVPGTYYVRLKATDTTNASANQELTIKGFISYTVTFKVSNGSWDDETTADKTVTLTGYEGETLKLAANQIPAVGTKPNDTYKAGSWDTTPSTDTEITAATTYTYTYAQKDSISQTVTFKVVNGSWDDDSTEDKTVTLTGYEGDTLKLTADQIPAVGTKPSDTYKAGSWDVTPSTDTAITAATTYTYTYAQKDSISQTVTFKVVNGSWDDETTADKTVTLTGYEGDTLKLAATDIPAVGTKPNDTYKAGSWDTTPSTDTEITAATTYTYTYAQKDSISQTVTFKVVNGSWDDETTEDKTVTLTGYEGDVLKLAAAQIPAVGDKPETNYKAGSWNVTPSADTAITADTTYTYTYAQKASISQTVTFKVVNGSWNDETATDKTVTLTGYEGDTLKLTADQIPTVGTKPNDTYKAGSWDVMPNTDTAITEATTYTYTYVAKEASVVIKAPEAKTLTYNGQAQELVTAGTATGGEMQYALGDANGATQPYTTSILTGIDAGTYYVWYKVVGDSNHLDSNIGCVTVTIATADSSDSGSGSTSSGSTDSGSGSTSSGSTDSGSGSTSSGSTDSGSGSSSSSGSSDSGNTSGGTSSGSSDNTNTNTDTSAKIPYDSVPISTGSVNDITGTASATAESNPFGTKIENNSNLTTLLSLTDAEVAQGVNVWLDIQDMSASVSQTDKTLIQNTSGDYTVGLYLDINLFKKVGSNDATKVTETNGKVKASIVIPESLWKSGRIFEIIRVHDGVATAIAGTYDENTHVFTFETDQFSTYALAYKDPASSSDSTSTSDSNSSNSSNSTQSTAPKTGDPNDIRVWYLLLIASLVGLGFLGYSKKKKVND